MPSAIFMPGQPWNLLAGVSANSSEFVGKRMIANLSITPLVVLVTVGFHVVINRQSSRFFKLPEKRASISVKHEIYEGLF